MVIEAARDENQPNEIWTAERLRRRAAIIRDLHEKLAATSPRGRSMIAANSGHFVQLYEPKVVVEAVQWVLAQSRLSRSGAAALRRDYVAAVNSGSPARLRGFHDRNAQRSEDAPERARFDARFHADTGGVVVRTTELLTAQSAAAVVESNLTGQRFRIQLSLDDSGRTGSPGSCSSGGEHPGHDGRRARCLRGETRVHGRVFGRRPDRARTRSVLSKGMGLGLDHPA